MNIFLLKNNYEKMKKIIVYSSLLLLIEVYLSNLLKAILKMNTHKYVYLLDFLL